MAGPLLLGCQDVAKAYGTRTLFDGVSFGIFEGDHACLVGPNGSGKSTLLKILAGLETPDSGTRSLRRQVRVGYVAQDPVFSEAQTLENVAARMLELSRAYAGGLLEAEENYSAFLEKRDEILRSEAAYQESLANI